MKLRTNADRIRRHRARSTPDEVRRYYDTISPEWLDQQRIYQDWINEFKKQMMIKHKGQGHVDIYLDFDAARMTYEVLALARYVPDEECGRNA